MPWKWALGCQRLLSCLRVFPKDISTTGTKRRAWSWQVCQLTVTSDFRSWGSVSCDFPWLCGICIHPTWWNHTSAFIVVTCVFRHTPTYWHHCQKEDIQQGRGKPLLPLAAPWMWELCEHLAFCWAVSVLPCTPYPCRQPRPLSCLCSKCLLFGPYFTHFIYMLYFSFYEQIDN